MATIRKIKRAVKRTIRRKNVASGRTTGRGAGRVFQPFRSSPDYDPKRAGEGKPRKKRKPAAKKTAVKKTVAKRKPVARKTAIRKAVAKKRAVTKRRPVVKARRKNPTVSLAVIKRQGASMKKEGFTAQAAWDWFRKNYPLLAEELKVKQAYLSAWHGQAKNPTKKQGPMSIFGGTNGPTLAQAKTAGSKYGSPSSEFSNAPSAAWDAYKNLISTYYMPPGKITKVKTAFIAGFVAARKSGGVSNPTGKLSYGVGKSKYKATMDKAKSLMPFSAAVQKGYTGEYFLMVDKKDASKARTLLNAMAKTMTKKAAKK